MSTIMSSILVIILWYFSLHATHAAFLDALAYHQIPTKDADDKMINHSEFSMESEAKKASLMPKELQPERNGLPSRDGGRQGAKSSGQYQKPDSRANLPSSSTTNTVTSHEESKGSTWGEVGSDSVVSVWSKSNIYNDHKRNSNNWEHHDHHPGFNLDYLPPRTHPPSHN